MQKQSLHSDKMRNLSQKKMNFNLSHWHTPPPWKRERKFLVWKQSSNRHTETKRVIIEPISNTPWYAPAFLKWSNRHRHSYHYSSSFFVAMASSSSSPLGFLLLLLLLVLSFAHADSSSGTADGTEEWGYTDVRPGNPHPPLLLESSCAFIESMCAFIESLWGTDWVFEFIDSIQVGSVGVMNRGLCIPSNVGTLYMSLCFENRECTFGWLKYRWIVVMKLLVWF